MGKERGERYAEGMARWGIALPEEGGGALHPARWFAEPKQGYVAELGIGTGDYLISCAAREPEVGYIGCEPYEVGIATAIKQAAERGLENVRFFQGDGRDLLTRLEPESLSGANVLFPDPWPKARHHKRRLVNGPLIALLARLIRPGGALFLATDHEDYAAWMLEVMGTQPWFDWQVETPAGLYEPPAHWVPTRYYQKALREGRRPIFLHYLKKAAAKT